MVGADGMGLIYVTMCTQGISTSVASLLQVHFPLEAKRVENNNLGGEPHKPHLTSGDHRSRQKSHPCVFHYDVSGTY